MHENFPKKNFFQHGFTVVELLVVFSILAILSVPAIASYVSFKNSQVFSNAVLDVKAVFQVAQSRAASGVKPAVCGNTILNDYEVHVCGNGVSCTNADNKHYELFVSCGVTIYSIQNTVLPANIVFLNQPAGAFVFPVLNGVVTPGSFDIQMTGLPKKTISIQNTGVIQIQ